MHKNIKKIKTKERENEKKALIRIIKLKWNFCRSCIPIRNIKNNNRLFAVLACLTEGLDRTLLLVVKIKKYLTNLVCIRGSISGRGQEIFLFSIVSRPASLFNAHRGALPPGVERPECESDNSPLSSDEVKEWRRYISSPHTSSRYGKGKVKR
jgi:hypothetical protein